MAFCKYCGRELKQGEVCSCTMQTKSENSNITNQEVISGEKSVNSKKEKQSQMQENVMNLLERAKNIYKNPYEEIPKQVKTALVKDSAIYIIVQAILSGVFAVCCIKKINSLIAIGGSYTATYKFSSVRAFILTLVYSLILSLILALLYFVGNKIIKSEIKYEEALAIVSIKAIATSPIIILGCILFAINPVVGVVTYFIGFFFSVFYLMYGMKQVGGVTDNQNIYISFVIILVFMIVYFLFAKQAAVTYIPESMKQDMTNINFSTLLNRFM